MGWIVGIVPGQGGLRVVERTTKGDAVVHLADAALTLSAHTHAFRGGDFVDLMFSDLQVAEDVDAFDRLGIPADARRVQTIFRYHRGRKTYYIPSQVLIEGLAAQNTLARRHLLTAAGFQLLAVLLEDEAQALRLEVVTIQGTRRTKFSFSPSFEHTLLWTACYPSAGRMVASIFQKAFDGRFDLALPHGRASLSFAGVHVGDEVLVQNVVMEWVEPHELPVAGLKGRVPSIIVCRERKNGAKRGGQVRKPSVDGGLQLGPAGWRLSDEEWQVVSAIHASTLREDVVATRGSFGRDLRGKVETVLRKLTEGVAWSKAGQHPSEGANAQAFWRGLQRDGRWERIKQYLNEARASQ